MESHLSGEGHKELPGNWANLTNRVLDCAPCFSCGHCSSTEPQGWRQADQPLCLGWH